jgi:hypothetical protein
VSKQQYVLTSRAVSVKADTSQQFVTAMAAQGRVPHVTASDGTRLFPETAAAIVRQLKAESIARRGVKKLAEAAT